MDEREQQHARRFLSRVADIPRRGVIVNDFLDAYRIEGLTNHEQVVSRAKGVLKDRLNWCKADPCDLDNPCRGCEVYMNACIELNRHHDEALDLAAWAEWHLSERRDDARRREVAPLLAPLTRSPAEVRVVTAPVLAPAAPVTLSPVPALPSVDLTAGQLIALKHLHEGRSLFLSGAAGTGKSFVVKEWRRLTKKKLQITASTGIAATIVGGMTIHRYTGAGIGAKPLHAIVNSDYWIKMVAPRIAEIDALLIDEISMLDGRMLDLVDKLCREARAFQRGEGALLNRPFGGLQVILVGDLGQLPPVEAEENGWCFESDAWRDLVQSGMQHVDLKQIVRQADERFAALLGRARAGRLTYEDEQILLERMLPPPAGVFPCLLRATNAEADGINQRELASIQSTELVYQAIEHGDPKWIEHLDRDCLSPRFLRLKPGARVMFTKNDMGNRYVNGTMGTVWECRPDRVIIQNDDGYLITAGRDEWKLEDGFGRTKALREQFPLRLAWAITIHKSQGATLDTVQADLSRVFAPGQAYVALSRVKSLEGLYLSGWCGRFAVRPHPKVVEFLGGDDSRVAC